jgi:hypothetical protein
MAMLVHNRLLACFISEAAEYTSIRSGNLYPHVDTR